MKSNKGFTLIELLIVVAIIGIIAAIAIPGLLRARQSGNEASGIGSMRSINSAEATYASSCGSGFYVGKLADLFKLPTAGGTSFIGPDLAADPSVKSTYTVNLAGTAAVGATLPTPCNAPSGLTSGYHAWADPADPSMRFFATNTSGTIFYGAATLSGITDTVGAGSPLQ